MNPEMQALAARRMGGGGSWQANLGGLSAQQSVGGHGLAGQKGGMNGPQLVGGPAPVASAPGSMPTPGVTGITPGAIERRVSPAPPASQQLSGPGMSPEGPMMGGGMQNPNAMVQNAPDLQGPARGDLNAPVGNLENFLRNLQNQRSQER